MVSIFYLLILTCTTQVYGQLTVQLQGSKFWGYVQVVREGEAKYICNDDWDIEDGRVLCKQLGLGDVFTTNGEPFNTGYTFPDVFFCDGNESILSECVQSQSNKENCAAAYVSCGEIDADDSYWGYIGCFQDNIERALPDLTCGDSATEVCRHCLDDTGQNYCYDDSGMTVNLCRQLCCNNGYRYAGLENGNQCFCGGQSADYDRHGELPPSDCSAPCRGNSSQECGGIYALNVYECVPSTNQTYYSTESFLHTTSERPMTSIDQTQSTTKSSETTPVNLTTIAMSTNKFTEVAVTSPTGDNQITKGFSTSAPLLTKQTITTKYQSYSASVEATSFPFTNISNSDLSTRSTNTMPSKIVTQETTQTSSQDKSPTVLISTVATDRLRPTSDSTSDNFSTPATDSTITRNVNTISTKIVTNSSMGTTQDKSSTVIPSTVATDRIILTSFIPESTSDNFSMVTRNVNTMSTKMVTQDSTETTQDNSTSFTTDSKSEHFSTPVTKNLNTTRRLNTMSTETVTQGSTNVTQNNSSTIENSSAATDRMAPTSFIPDSRSYNLSTPVTDNTVSVNTMSTNMATQEITQTTQGSTSTAITSNVATDRIGLTSFIPDNTSEQFSTLVTNSDSISSSDNTNRATVGSSATVSVHSSTKPTTLTTVGLIGTPDKRPTGFKTDESFLTNTSATATATTNLQNRNTTDTISPVSRVTNQTLTDYTNSTVPSAITRPAIATATTDANETTIKTKMLTEAKSNITTPITRINYTSDSSNASSQTMENILTTDHAADRATTEMLTARTTERTDNNNVPKENSDPSNQWYLYMIIVTACVIPILILVIRCFCWKNSKKHTFDYSKKKPSKIGGVLAEDSECDSIDENCIITKGTIVNEEVQVVTIPSYEWVSMATSNEAFEKDFLEDPNEAFNKEDIVDANVEHNGSELYSKVDFSKKKSRRMNNLNQ